MHGISLSDPPIRGMHDLGTGCHFADIANGPRTSAMNGVSVFRDRERLSGWKYISVARAQQSRDETAASYAWGSGLALLPPGSSKQTE